MKALFDTNVVLDVLLDRRPFSAPATHLFAKLEVAQLGGLAVVDRQVLELAAGSSFEDFEDAVLHEAGRLGGADLLVTRDPADFSRGSLPVLSPEELLATLEVAGTNPSDE
ncbi:MAG TPA: PIN domain-containing protein [Thermoanaerobaculia bacterium]